MGQAANDSRRLSFISCSIFNIFEGWKCERCKATQKTTTTTTTTTTSTTTTITTTSTTTVQPSLHPINLVVLLDGSDSIRSSKKEELDEWNLALNRVNDFIDAFKLGQRNERQEDYLSFVQFSRDVKGHLLGEFYGSRFILNNFRYSNRFA